jgi:hypothetical protein
MCALSVHQKKCQKSLGCALSIKKYGTILPVILFLGVYYFTVFGEYFRKLCIDSKVSKEQIQFPLPSPTSTTTQMGLDPFMTITLS